MITVFQLQIGVITDRHLVKEVVSYVQGRTVPSAGLLDCTKGTTRLLYTSYEDSVLVLLALNSIAGTSWMAFHGYFSY